MIEVVMDSYRSPKTPEFANAAQMTFESTENFTNVTEENGPCLTALKLLDSSSRIMFFYSILITFTLSFIVRRKALWLSCCWGRPGLLQPIDFIDEFERRWAYGACFVAITFDVTNLFLGVSFWDLLPTNDEEWMKNYGWVQVFTILLDALSVCLVYYPLLACINHRKFIPANVIGLLYAIPWIWFYCDYFNNCPISNQEDHGIELFAIRVPIFISYFIVGFSYILDFALNVHRWRKQRPPAGQRADYCTFSNETRCGIINHRVDSIVNLLYGEDTEEVEERNGVRLKPEKIANGFRYSTGMICCVTMCTTVLIWFLVIANRKIDLFLTNDTSTYVIAKQIFEDPEFDKHLMIVKLVAHVSNAFSALVVFIMLVHTLVIYKHCWHQLRKGVQSWHTFGNTIESSHLLNSLRYAGYQVAFVIWGWVVLTVFVFVVLMIVTFGFIIPLMNQQRNWLIQTIIDNWKTVLVGIMMFPVAQSLMCRFLLLRRNGSLLAPTNRRLYNAISYYFLVLNVVVGIFAFMERILISFILGIAFLSRLDQPLMMRRFESYDPGYASFVSMLMVDLHHKNLLARTSSD